MPKGKHPTGGVASAPVLDPAGEGVYLGDTFIKIFQRAS
jgi:hypothetical protein